MRGLALLKRDGTSNTTPYGDGDDDDDDDTCTGFCDAGYVRWIVAVIIIVVVISLIILVWTFSVRKTTGRWALSRAQAQAAAARDAEADTDGGVIRNSARRRRNRNRARRNADDVDPVPVYNERPGDTDAGYYDANGLYVAYEPPPYEPPKAMVRTQDVELDNITEETNENLFDHEPSIPDEHEPHFTDRTAP